MKKLMCALAVAMSAVAFAQTMQGPVKDSVRRGPTPEDVAMRREFIQKITGGFVQRKAKEPGVCFAVDGFDPKVLEFTASELTRVFSASVYVRSEKLPTLEDVRAAVRKGRDRVVISICSAPGMPAILPVPDERCALVNLDFLTADKPSKEKLAQRITKQAQRAFGFLCAPWTPAPACVMKFSPNLAMLDANSGYLVGPDVFMGVYRYLESLKCAPGGQCTYKAACFEGWAPEPTNDYQRVIYEGVKSGKIKPGDKPELPPRPKKK